MNKDWENKGYVDEKVDKSLLQWRRPDKRKLVIQALKTAGREDLIGYGPECLVRPDRPANRKPKAEPKKSEPPKKSEGYKKGWAKPKPKKNAKPNKRRKGK